jgi:hypothetical protein
MLMVLIYREEAYILYRKTRETLVVTSQKIGAEGDADKSKYMVMSRDQNAGQSHNVKADRLIVVPVKGWNSSDVWEQP